MRNRILQHICNNPEIFGETGLPTSLDAILLSRQSFRRSGRQRLTWLIFRAGQPRPSWVARHYANPRWNDLLEQEYAICAKLHAKLPVSIVPEPLSFALLEGQAVAFERWFDGRTLSAELARQVSADTDSQALYQLIEKHLAIVRDLILTLHAEAQPANADDLKRELLGCFQTLRSGLVSLDPDEVMLLDAALSRLLHLPPALPIRKRLVNLDLVPFNILRSPSSVRVIDWEYHEVGTLWFHEPLKFVYWYLFDLSRLGVLGVSPKFDVAFKQYFAGENGSLAILFNRFLCSLDLPADDPVLLQRLWLAFFLREIDLIASVSSSLLSHHWITLRPQLDVVLQADGLRRAYLINELQQREEQIKTLVTEREQTIQQLSTQLAEREQNIAEQKREIEELHSKVSERDRALEIYNERLTALARDLEESQEKIRAIWSSNSWKVTRPFRFISRLMRPGRKRVLYEALKRAYWSLPERTRIALSPALRKAVEIVRRDHPKNNTLPPSASSNDLDWLAFQKHVLAKRSSYKGLFILEHTIDWNVPLFQRPQHMATAL
ncbi:MAG: hypothetical protein NZM42_13600, partial [Gemmatales bacterium]|nr:hypothetical protein [Gemmatales bacterium]